MIHDVEPVRLRSGVPFRHLPLHVSIANSTERHRGHALLRSFRVKGLKKGFHGLLRVSFGGQLFDGADDAGLPFSIALLSRFVVPNSQVKAPLHIIRHFTQYYRNDYAGVEQWSRTIVRDHYVYLVSLHQQHERFAKVWDNNLRLQGFAEAFEQQETPRT